jgi:hypothetical protein
MEANLATQRCFHGSSLPDAAPHNIRLPCPRDTPWKGHRKEIRFKLYNGES